MKQDPYNHKGYCKRKTGGFFSPSNWAKRGLESVLLSSPHAYQVYGKIHDIQIEEEPAEIDEENENLRTQVCNLQQSLVAMRETIKKKI